jgi:hypothetical protein
VGDVIAVDLVVMWWVEGDIVVVVGWALFDVFGRDGESVVEVGFGSVVVGLDFFDGCWSSVSQDSSSGMVGCEAMVLC